MTIKSYKLICPSCKGTHIFLPAGSPHKPKCEGCGTFIDMEVVFDFVQGWLPFLKDRATKMFKANGDIRTIELYEDDINHDPNGYPMNDNPVGLGGPMSTGGGPNSG
jgi:hypothetical protein